MPKQVNGIWIPSEESHLGPFLEKGPEFAGRGTYQLHKFIGCLPYCRNYRVAIDIGAHCGLWTRVMAQCFTRVVAFEPIPDHQDCWRLNVGKVAQFPDGPGATLLPYALSDKEQQLELCAGTSSTGDTHVKSRGDTTKVTLVQAKMLRQFAKLLPIIDFIKIDTEGWEYFILMGGEELIRHHKPMILVEQKSGKASAYGIKDKAAVDLLEAWGATKVYERAGDFGMKWT